MSVPRCAHELEGTHLRDSYSLQAYAATWLVIATRDRLQIHRTDPRRGWEDGRLVQEQSGRLGRVQGRGKARTRFRPSLKVAFEHRLLSAPKPPPPRHVRRTQNSLRRSCVDARKFV